MVVAVAQLEEQSVPTPEIHRSNLVIGNFVLKLYLKKKIKVKEPSDESIQKHGERLFMFPRTWRRKT